MIQLRFLVPATLALLAPTIRADKPTIEVARLNDGGAGQPGAKLVFPAQAATVKALQPNDKSVKFVVPAALKPGGALWLVANRHLPYEDVLDARFGEVSEVASSGAFKVIHAVRARASAARARA